MTRGLIGENGGVAVITVSTPGGSEVDDNQRRRARYSNCSPLVVDDSGDTWHIGPLNHGWEAALSSRLFIPGGSRQVMGRKRTKMRRVKRSQEEEEGEEM